MLNDEMGIPTDAEQRKFTGIWIPAEIWLNDNLSGLAKMLYAEIASFGSRGCWKKSEELYAPLGIQRITFQKLCRELVEGGYIEEQRKFGRIVRTSTLKFRSSAQILHQSKKQSDEQSKKQSVQKEYSKNKEKNKLLTKVNKVQAPIEPVENLVEETQPQANADAEQPKTYGNADVNDVLERWKHITDNDCTKIKRERFAVNNLLKKYSSDELDDLLVLVARATESGDRYAPSITKPSELVGQYSKLDKLKAWEKRQEPEGRTERFMPAPPMAFAPFHNPASELEPIRKLSDEEYAEASRVIEDIKATAKWYKPKDERGSK